MTEAESLQIPTQETLLVQKVQHMYQANRNQEVPTSDQPPFLYAYHHREGEPEIVGRLKTAHDLATLMVYTADQPMTASEVCATLVGDMETLQHDADAGILLAIDRGSIEIISGGVLRHPSHN